MAIDNDVEVRRTPGPADTPQHRNREAGDGDHNTESREKRPSIEDTHRDECPSRCTFLKSFVHEVLVLTSAKSIIYPNTTLRMSPNYPPDRESSFGYSPGKRTFAAVDKPSNIAVDNPVS